MAQRGGRRRWLRWSLSLLAAGILLGLFASWWVAGSLLEPANHAVGPPPADLPVEVATLKSASGSEIAAWYIPAEHAAATLVLVHPMRGSRTVMLDRARLFREAGYSLVLIDLQAHGESPGEHITAGYLERFDVQAAVAYARQKNPGHRIGVAGVSLGAAAAVLGSPLGIDALIIESMYPSIDEAVYDRVHIRLGPLSSIVSTLLLAQLQPRLGISRSQLRPIDKLASVECPLLVMAGDEDRHTPLEETRRIFDRAKDPKELVIFKGAEHVDLQVFSPQQYRERALTFLAAHLSPP